MAKKIKPVPTGYRTVTPYLVARGADAALEFYASAFGATIVSRHMDETDTYVMHAEMKIGNAIVLVCDEAPELGILSPVSLGATPVAMHLYLSDLDMAWDRAVAAGASVLVPLHDTAFGERFGKVVDPFGHVWTLAMRIALPSNENRPAKIEEKVVEQATAVDAATTDVVEEITLETVTEEIVTATDESAVNAA